MGNGNPRHELGLSLDDAAQAIGVSRGTLTRYELNPRAVGEARRERIEAFYRDLHTSLERARAARKGSSREAPP